MEAPPSAYAQRPPSHVARNPQSTHRIPRVVIVAVATLLAVVVGVGSAWAYNYNKLDLTWYTNDPDATEFTISTAGQMQAFSALVNGDAKNIADKPIAAVSFAGKTVKLAGSLNLFAAEFTPIGTDAHPFGGTFDGQGGSIERLHITSGTSDVGLFGVAAEGSVIKNVSLGDQSVVTLKSDKDVFEDVGSLVGDCRGSIQNCSSKAKVSLDYTATTPTGSVMKNVGGVVGRVQGAVSGTSFGGALRAETPANAYQDEKDATVSTVVENVGGVAGWFGSDLSGCSNAGTLLVITSGASGIDRFGAVVEAKSLYVGGVGGYGLGNVSDCHNTATLFTTSLAGATFADIDSQKVRQADGGADGLGGVIGSLRGIAMSGLGDNRGDPGLEEGAAPLVLTDCSNTGYVTGLHTVGGIVGSQGSNTTVTRCTNGTAGADAKSNVGHVRTTRWNKPAGGGIAGQSWGVISYSRNHGQSENTKTGYFTAGICGMLEKHETQQSTPEIYACYNTGSVYCGGATAAFYEGGIVGELDGGCYVHDNVFMYGTVSTHLSDRTDANDLAVGRNYGTVANTSVVYETAKKAAEKKGVWISSGETVAILNKLTANTGWKSYYFISNNANNAYPVLNGQAVPDAMIDLSKVACTIEFSKNAKYTAASNPAPTLKVSITVDGKTTELVQGSDYKVVADAGALDENGTCKGLTNGEKPYQATIEGIGNYYGTPAQKTAYGIDRGDFSECTVSVVNGKWTGKALNNPSVSVVDAGGSVVDAGDYTVKVNNGEDCVKVLASYPVTATASSSSNYSGTAAGVYAIDAGDVYKDSDIIGVVYNNRVWYYDEDKNDLYEVIPADASGNALVEGAELVYYQDSTGKSLPCVLPQSYVDANGKQSTRTLYQSEDGRWLTVAEPKHKDAEGKPVYGDMAVDFTGSAIEPQMIGVLYPCATDKGAFGDYSPAWLSGVRESEITTDNPASKYDYFTHYGYAGDATQRLAPRNTNATTSDDKPEASVMVYGIKSGNFANYAYMDFKINKVAATADNLKVVVKKNTLPYSSGALPATPVATRNDVSGMVNSAVEVRYVPEGATYDENNPATYCVLEGSNWKLEFDHGTDAEGNAVSAGGYAAGSRLYYNVVPTDTCSLTGWGKVAVVDPLIVESSDKVDLANNIIEVVLEQGKTWSIKNPHPAIVSMTNTVTGEQLVEGVDYAISRAGTDNAPPRYDEATDTLVGVMYINAMGANYSGSRTVEYTVGKGDVSDLMKDGSIVNQKFVFIDPDSGMTAISKLPYRVNGWNASDLSEVLTLNMGNAKYIFDSVALVERACLTVTNIAKNGVSVDAIQGAYKNKDVYTLTVVCDGDNTKYVESNQPFEVTISTKLLSFGTTELGQSVGSKMFTKMDLEQHEFMYTGKPVTVKPVMFDGAGNLSALSMTLVWVNDIKTAPTEPGDYNTPHAADPTNTAIKDRYDDLRITGDGDYYGKSTNTSLDSTGSKQSYAIPGVVDLSFKIVAADIADNQKVEVKVDEAYYADGAEVKPGVTFYDAQTGEQLDKFTRDDYTLTYKNNTQVGRATVVVTPSNNGHLSVHGDMSGATGFEVPFTIMGDGVQTSQVPWDHAATVVVHSDGSLSEPGVVGALDGVTFTAGTDYRVEAGVLDGVEFAEKKDGWKAGDQVFYRVTGIKDGVLAGTVVLDAVQAVAATDANTFKNGSAALKAAAASTVYTGAAATPVVTAADGASPLVEGRDFKVACSVVNAGDAEATVSGLGAYAGSTVVSFAIAPADMASLKVEAANKVYAGRQITLDAADVSKVELGGVVLPAADYALEAEGYGENLNALNGGTATLVPASGNLTGSVKFLFGITPAPLVNSELNVTVVDSKAYTGTGVELGAGDLAVHDTKRDRDLVFGEDYTVAGYGGNVNVGTATVYLAGAGNYSASDNTVTATFGIVAADFGAAEVQGINEAYEFCGKNNPVQPEPRVVLNGVELPASDFQVTYGANNTIGVDAGTLTVTPQGTNVTGQAKTASFDITVDVSKATVESIPNATFEPGGSYEPDLQVSFNGAELEAGVHYSVKYDSAAAGTKTLVLTGIDPCTGTKKVTYGIDGKPLVESMVDVQLSGLVYTGAALEPAVVLTDGGVELVEGTDYDVTYENNVDATADGAPATLTVTGKGNYAGMLTKTFAIAPKPLDSSSVLAEALATGLFSGAAVGAQVSASDTAIVVDAVTGKTYALVEGTDFTRTYANNAAVGTATVTLVGKGNYTGTLPLTYSVKGDLSAAQVAALSSLVYTGAALAPAPTVTLAGVTLIANTDYTVAYSANTQPGTASVTLSGAGSYEGSKTATFVITAPARVDATTGIVVSGTALVDLAAEGAEVQVITRALAADSSLLAQVKDTFATADTEAFLGFEVTLQTVKDGRVQVVRDSFGQLTLSLPVGAVYDGRTVTVIVRHTAEDGTVTFDTRRVVIAEGKATFTVDKFSEFFVAIDKVPAVDGGNTGTADGSTALGGTQGGSAGTLASTGDVAGGFACALVALAGLAAALVFLAFPAIFRKMGR
ncbi:MAG: hypothetical protein VB027_04550 [Gordonibacter sp.]|nr:hypothetical protein [Gordonibacter sp.]